MLVSVAKQAGLNLTFSETPKTGFLADILDRRLMDWFQLPKLLVDVQNRSRKKRSCLEQKYIHCILLLSIKTIFVCWVHWFSKSFWYCTTWLHVVKIWINGRVLEAIWSFHIQGAHWLIGRVLDSRLKGCQLEPYRWHCVVSLSKAHTSLLSTGSTQEKPTQHDWKTVKSDVKNQINYYMIMCKVLLKKIILFQSSSLYQIDSNEATKYHQLYSPYNT